MIAVPPTEIVPIERDEYGMIRVGGTRVTLQTVVAAFNRGGTPETIVDQYPALALSDVYLVARYDLRHRDEIDADVHEQAQIAAHIRQENDSHFGTQAWVAA
jgi:uncharacterized protein (DUF433 family)